MHVGPTTHSRTLQVRRASFASVGLQLVVRHHSSDWWATLPFYSSYFTDNSRPHFSIQGRGRADRRVRRRGSDLVGTVALLPTLLSYHRAQQFSSIRPPRDIDHKEPRPIGLATDHLCVIAGHRDRFAIRAGTGATPLPAQQGEIPIPALDCLDLHGELGLECQITLHDFANGCPARDYLA